MTVIDNIKNFYCRVAGRFYVPPEVIESNETKIVHISDTPTNLYQAFEELINVLSPEVVVHTGDLADDIKLEVEPDNWENHGSSIIAFLDILERSPAEKIYLVPGNHDDERIINRNIKRIRVINEGEVVYINNLRLGLAHRINRLPGVKGYKLYGHNFDRGNEYYLNGMENVNVILSPSERVIKIPYPLAINYERKMENAYGIPRTI